MSSKTIRSAAFSETLQFITSIKLEELEKQRTAYYAHTKVIDEANALGHNNLERLEKLLHAVQTAPSAGAASSTLAVAGGLNLQNLSLWIRQAKTDPSISPTQIAEWSNALEAHIRRGEASFDYAKLFGRLFTEWLASKDSSSEGPAAEAEATGDGDGNVDPEEGFHEVGRKELHEQREQYEARVFADAPPVEVEPFRKYMEELFSSNREATLTLEQVRKKIGLYAKTFSNQRVQTYPLKQTIENLLKQDLLNNEKRATLTEFARNDTILEEVASVLNMHLGRIGSWSWPDEGIALEMRRALNGKYRFFMDEELLLALFLHHIGLLWSVKLKKEFKNFLHRAWKPTVEPLTAEERERRQLYLDSDVPEETIESERRQYQHQYAFLGQLTGNVKEDSGYDEDGDEDPGRATSAKQVLLDHLNTEMLIGRTAQNSFTVVLSDFEWFGPSLDFDILLATLEFFGVPPEWLSFFRTFLEAPLKFKGDPANTEVRKRKRGTPVGHALSTLFGEALLFVMDYAVNQRADGLFLYRIHDDLWLWDPNTDRVRKGWQEMEVFAKLAGLTFNKEKTGSVTIGDASVDGLPTGNIRWGFLQLDAKAARFVVDNAMIDKHIAELRRQLGSAESVFGVVNRFNFYIRFIARNLGGRPSNSFGQAHVDQMIAALSRVQKELFEGEDILGHLKKMVAQRFGVDDAPLGWYFMPNALGGLGLHNPLVELLALRENIFEDPEKLLLDATENDNDTYRRKKEEYETGVKKLTRGRGGHSNTSRWDQKRPHWNFSFEDYVSGRENAISSWYFQYKDLLDNCVPHEIVATSDVNAAIAVLSQSSNGTYSQYTNFSTLSFYDKWIMTLYCSELTTKFGSFAIVDPALIPIGMLEVFRGTKVRWEQ